MQKKVRSIGWFCRRGVGRPVVPFPVWCSVAFKVVICGLGVTACTHLPWQPYRGWRAYEAGPVTVYANTSKEHRLALEYLVASYAIFKGTFFRSRTLPAVEAVYLPPEENSPFTNNAGTKKFGVFVRRAPTPRRGDGGPLLLVGRWSELNEYAHILAHHFIETTIPNAPVWFHEGFATYLRLFSMSSDRPGVVCFGLRPMRQWDLIVPPLQKLFALTPKAYNDKEALWAAPMGWAFVHYLLHGEDGRYRVQFWKFLNGLAAGTRGEAALREAFGDVPIETFNSALRDYVRQERNPDLCPLPVRLTNPGHVGDPQRAVASGVAEDDIRKVFETLESLPDRTGNADVF